MLPGISQEVAHGLTSIELSALLMEKWRCPHVHLFAVSLTESATDADNSRMEASRTRNFSNVTSVMFDIVSCYDICLYSVHFNRENFSGRARNKHVK